MNKTLTVHTGIASQAAKAIHEMGAPSVGEMLDKADVRRVDAVSTGSPAVPVGVLENVAQLWRRRAEGLRNEAKALKQNARWQGRKRRFLAAQLDSMAMELDLLIAAATVRQPQENISGEGSRAQ